MASPTLPNCEYRRDGGRPLCIVAEHHQVLLPWARLRRETGEALTILTLDHHTDVLPAFGSRPSAGFSYADDAAVAAAIAGLHHDEHLDWAVRAGVARRCWVIAQENFTPPANAALTVICDPVWPPSAALFAGTVAAREAADAALETTFLSRQLELTDWWQARVPVLDVDLDYFLTARALRPGDDTLWRRLLRHAALITISLEADWVRILRLPGETITAASILAHLDHSTKNPGEANFTGVVGADD